MYSFTISFASVHFYRGSLLHQKYLCRIDTGYDQIVIDSSWIIEHVYTDAKTENHLLQPNLTWYTSVARGITRRKSR